MKKISQTTGEDGSTAPPTIEDGSTAQPTAREDASTGQLTGEDGSTAPLNTGEDGSMAFIFLTETGLKHNIFFDLIRSCPIGCNGNYVHKLQIKGVVVATIYSERYIVQHRFVFEYLKLTIKQSNKTDLLITIVYRPPRSSEIVFHSQFGEMLSTIGRKHRKIIIAVILMFENMFQAFE